MYVRSTNLLTTASHAALLTGLMAISATASAQQAPSGGAIQLPPVSVQAPLPPPPENVLQRENSINRMPGSIQDTPQVINVVPKEIMEQKNVTTLDQALRNVPGVTVTIGEGGGGMNGDQFRVRGFEAKGDIFENGLRDFGVFTRDSFILDEVQVLKGPSGGTFGLGTTGGAINMVTKAPQLENFYGGTASFGSGPMYRGTVDVNQKIGDSTAVRINAMGTSADAVDRDKVKSDRWGFAPSIAFGLGTDTNLTLQYFHQQDNRTPDYGVPVVTRPGQTVGKPVTEYGVRRANWYGTDTDTDDSTVDTLTARFQHKANDWLTLSNDARVGIYSRRFTPSAISCTATNNCLANFFDNSASTVPLGTIGGPGPFDQDTWGAQNIFSGIARFHTGSIRHEVVGGFDVSFQHDERDQFIYSPARPLVNILSPNPGRPTYGILPGNTATAYKESEATNAALFVSDRVWLVPEFSVIAGVRWDNYWVDYKTTGPGFPVANVSSDSSFLNPRLALVWEPSDSQTYYASYATSTSPPGQFVAQGPNPLVANTSGLDPEENRIYEIGAKWSLLGGKLGVSAAVFRIEKDNAKELDPLTATIVSSGDAQRNQGVEIGVTGKITPAWTLYASYAYFDSETTSSLTAANVGKRVQYVPESSATLWTTYELFGQTRYHVTLGGGVTYRDGVFLNPANTAEVPETFTVDAMISHRLNDNWRIALNGYNLTDELNYDSLFGNRAIPAAGRTFILSVSAMY